MLNFPKPLLLIKYLIVTGFVVSVVALNIFQYSTPSSSGKPILENWSQQEIEFFQQYNTVSGKIVTDKAQDIEIEYQIFGTVNVDNTSLHIRLSKGISIVSDSIYDTFNEKDTKLETRLFNSQINQLVYGPGTTTSTVANLKAGDKGKVRFQIRVTEPSIQNFALVSYIRDGSGKIVQPSVLQLNI